MKAKQQHKATSGGRINLVSYVATVLIFTGCLYAMYAFACRHSQRQTDVDKPGIEEVRQIADEHHLKAWEIRDALAEPKTHGRVFINMLVSQALSVGITIVGFGFVRLLVTAFMPKKDGK
jgi:hypothetical protein